MKETFLKDNIRSLLALIWSLIAGIILILLINRLPIESDITKSIVQGVFGIIMFKFGYYYSASKDKLPINNSNNQTTETK
jgi:hypothetical protein